MDKQASESIFIRPARAGDRDGLDRLYREVQAMHHAARPEIYPAPHGTLVDEAWFTQKPKRRDQALLVALKGREVVGLVLVARQQVSASSFQVARLIARIDALAVGTSHRRNGIGTLLIGAARDWAQRQGVVEMRLSVDAFNTGAVGFYEKLGFAVTWHWMTSPLPPGDAE